MTHPAKHALITQTLETLERFRYHAINNYDVNAAIAAAEEAK